MMADLHDFAQHVGLQSMDMSSPALPMPQLNRASRRPPPATLTLRTRRWIHPSMSEPVLLTDAGGWSCRRVPLE